MAKIQCKMCGGMNEVKEGATSWECPYCGMLTTFPKLDTEQREQLYNRAERFRQANNFDKAVAAYEAILDLDNEDPEAYWGVLISRYGIEYVEDPATHERIPTCHRVQFESILADPDYLNAVKYAVGYDKDIYEKEARKISDIQKDILRISAQEKPYDVFICYKETTDGGSRTKDSILAQDMYDHLTAQGLKVFFARITLEDKLGEQYEPYIFAALNSAKVMLVVGSKKEHFEAVWVKNEWSRFLALKRKDRSKLLIPCFVDMDAYDIPEELQMFQSQDMGKIGFMQDLVRGIRKVTGVGQAEAKPDAAASSGVEMKKIIKRIAVLMEQKDWDKACSYCEKLLESEPENSELYLLMCMLTRQIPNEEALKECCQNLNIDKNFQMAIKFAPPERKAQLESLGKDASANFSLKKCMLARGVSDLSLLPRSDAPLCEDKDFQLSLNSATPELKEKLLALQVEQSDYFLRKSMESNAVSKESELSHCPRPLCDDHAFQTAVKSALPERKKELLRIQAEQPAYFLRRCMEANQVTSESELAGIPRPLIRDRDYQTAIQTAPPERKKELLRIQAEQPECFLRRCMEANQVSSEDGLIQVNRPLQENPDFRMAMECASPERRAQLQNIQTCQQSMLHLRKCMEQCKVSREEDLIRARTRLADIPDFQKAYEYASPSRRNQLQDLASRQLKEMNSCSNRAKRGAVGGAIAGACFGALLLLGAFSAGESSEYRIRAVLFAVLIVIVCGVAGGLLGMAGGSRKQ